MKRQRFAWIIGMVLCGQTAYAGYEEQLQIGSQALRSQQLEQAIHAFSQVITATDTTPEQRVTARGGRCAAYYRQSLANKESKWAHLAIDDCSLAMAIQADYQRAYLLRGTAYLTTGSLDRALADLNVAVALNPQDHLALQNRGLVKVHLHQLESALVDFDATIRINPDQPWSHYNRGQVYLHHNKPDLAIADFDIFIRLKPDHGPAYLHRGQANLLAERYQQAEDDLTTALQIQPGNAAAHASRGIARFLQGNYLDAEADLWVANKETPPDIENQVWLFLDLEWQKKPSAAIFKAEGSGQTAGSEAAGSGQVSGGQASGNGQAASGSSTAMGMNAGQSLVSEQWPGVVVALLRTDIPIDRALTVAQQTPDADVRQERENLLFFLMGQLALLQKLPDQAKQWFTRVTGEQSPTVIRYAARRALRQLEAAATLATVSVPTTRGGQLVVPDRQPAVAQAPPPSVAVAAVSQAPAPSVAPVLETTPDATRVAPSAPTASQTAAPSDLPVVINTDRAISAGNAVVRHERGALAPLVAVVTPAAEVLPAQLPPPSLAKAKVGHLVDDNADLTGDVASEIDFMAARKTTINHPKGKYAFKLGAFQNTANADKALADATRLKLPVYIQEVEVNKQPHIRVWIGPFNSEAEAQEAKQRVQKIPGTTSDVINKF